MVAGMPERETMSVNIAEALINAGANIDVEVRPATTFGFGVYGTPLHKAASVNHIETVKLLLKHGANVDAEDDSDNSPLHLASMPAMGIWPGYSSKRGPMFRPETMQAIPPIQMAALCRSAGGDQAARCGRLARQPSGSCGGHAVTRRSIAGPGGGGQVLLEAGADVNAANNGGKTSLHLARQHGHEAVAAVLQAAD